MRNNLFMRLILCFILIVACVFTVSLPVYAFFSHGVSSASNLMKTAHFETMVYVSCDDGETMLTADSAKQELTLKAGKIYTVTAMPSENSTAQNGFTVISAEGCDRTYYMSFDGGHITFTMILTEDTNVSFFSHWGTVSDYGAYYGDGGISLGSEILITIN